MRITTQGDYALRCMLNIAAKNNKGPVCISRICREEGLPLDYIEQLLIKLRRKKLIKSTRGVKGGYVLGKDAFEITVKDVIEAVEGEAFEVICSRVNNRKARKCAANSECVLRDVWMGLKGEIERFLSSETIGSLLDKSGQGSA